MSRASVIAAALAASVATARTAAAQRGIDDTLDAAEADSKPTNAEPWNTFDVFGLFTLHVGAGLLIDYAAFDQDAASKEQMELSNTWKLRDMRILLKGKLLFAPRVSYTLGYMYDGPTNTFRFRQTGLMIDFRELAGDLFIGRTKEGFSTNKLMVGYHGWTMERAAANDAFLPILADGVKWTGRAGDHVVYNVGWFIDTLSENESFNKNDRQLAARVVWLPLAHSDSSTVLHVAVEARYAAANDGMLQYRSRPEAFPAQGYAVDTGTFPADHSETYGFEAYVRPGSLTIGSEYFLNPVAAPTVGNPFFHGGEAFASYLFTGEVHPYNERGAFFEAVSPDAPITVHGTGAIEAVFRASYVDLDSGAIAGGTFWRLTPMVNWYLSDNLRFEAAYGYGVTHDLGLTGHTQFFQTRLQLTLN